MPAEPREEETEEEELLFVLLLKDLLVFEGRFCPTVTRVELFTPLPAGLLTWLPLPLRRVPKPLRGALPLPVPPCRPGV